MPLMVTVRVGTVALVTIESGQWSHKDRAWRRLPVRLLTTWPVVCPEARAIEALACTCEQPFVVDAAAPT